MGAENNTKPLRSKSTDNGGSKKFGRRNDDQNYGNRRFSRKPHEVSPLFKQLVADGELSIKLGAKLCFYTNKLNCDQIEELAAKTKRQADKVRASNWLNVTCFTEDGNKPCEALSEAITAYKGFSDEEDKDNRLNIYGAVTLKFDFSKINLITTEDNCVKYPYGILFFSDSRHIQDKYAASVACVQNRIPKKNQLQDSFFTPILDYEKAECTGICRSSGHFVVFYVDHEIEKNKNELHPEITLVEIEVGVTRSGKWGVIDNTFISTTSKASTCVPDDVQFMLDHVFAHYGVTESNFVSDFIYLIGLDPREYNYIPTQIQAGGEYYGGHAHVAKKPGISGKSGADDGRKKNLFRYIDQVERDSADDVVRGSGKKNKKIRKDKAAASPVVDSPDTSSPSVSISETADTQQPASAPIENAADVNTAVDTDIVLDSLHSEEQTPSTKEA